MDRKRLAVRELALIPVFSALICVCAWITIPASIPFTLQVLGVFLTLRLLGGRKGTIAVGVYILLGLVGLPLFSGFQAGAGALLGPTGGYIVGFLLMGLVYWLGEPLTANRILACALLFGGLIVCYAFGTAWFMYVSGTKGKELSLLESLGMCVFPYILPDALKLAASELIASRAQKILHIKAF
ncbi:MAG: biotin transporter BioY [Clostridiales bacterium]|nr:biotin transporter BioY [Clostridiales bacterium]